MNRTRRHPISSLIRRHKTKSTICHESFFVGGHYVEVDGETFMTGQAFVHLRTPSVRRYQWPIVMLHGRGQTAMNYETTPDGRKGWADFFAEQGFAVCTMDQPARGRSAYHFFLHGEPKGPGSVQHIQEHFAAHERFNQWPQAKFHTQWPGEAQLDDATFDQFYASQVPEVKSDATIENLMRAAGASLLDRIGPAVVVSHSQSGSHGWQMADARPNLVKAIIALEPGGPPFVAVDAVGPPLFQKDGELNRPYGIAKTALCYDPPVSDPAADLLFYREETADDDTLVHCHLQREPAKKLVNLALVPVMVVSSESSYHAGYDHCTVKYLRQAGVIATHLRLQDVGIHGNGHMMMLEKNNLEVAQLLIDQLHGLNL